MSSTVLALIGIASLIIIMVLIFKKICPVYVAFLIVLLILPFLLGYGFSDLGKWFSDGLSGQARLIGLVICCVPFFFIQNELGSYDGIVSFIVKKLGGKPMLVMVAGWLVATLGAISANSAAALMITVPAVLPLYKRTKIRPAMLATQLAVIMGPMGMVPWGSPNMYRSSLLGVDGASIFVSSGLCYAMIFGYIFGFCTTMIMGYFELKRIQAGKNDYLLEGLDNGEQVVERNLTPRQKKMRPVNLLLIVVLISAFLFNWVNYLVASFILTAILLLLNYGNDSEMGKVFTKCAPMVMGLMACFVAVGGFLEMFKGTGIMEAITQLLISAVPESMMKYLGYLFACIYTPGDFFLCNTLAVGVMPIVANTIATAGVCSMSAAHAMMMTCANCGVFCCISSANQYLLLDMTGVELKDHVKRTLPLVALQSIAHATFLLVFGYAFL